MFDAAGCAGGGRAARWPARPPSWLANAAAIPRQQPQVQSTTPLT